MKQTNLNIFYRLGAVLQEVAKISTDMPYADYFLQLWSCVDWLKAFLDETKDVPLPASRAAANALLVLIDSAINPPDLGRSVKQDEVVGLFRAKQKFEEEFEREHRNLDVFTVLPKGIYNTRLLIEHPEEKFPVNVRKYFPTKMIYDLEQAGRCLAFDTPTACAFHVVRGTEALILRYYEALAGKPWPHFQRDWGRYISELERLPGVNRDVTMRLGEIQRFDRNPYIHPEANVSLDKAPVLFELCTGVIHIMADEIGKLSP